MSKAGGENSGGGGGGGEFVGRKVAERKSKFSVTCGRLSQYLKEKGSFGDLGLGISRPFDPQAKPGAPTRKTNLPPTVIDLSSDEPQTKTEPTAATSLLPDLNITKSSHSSHFVPPPKKPETEQQVSQMTIFYRGKIFVFDHFTVDKANELVAMANRGNTPGAAADYHATSSVNFQGLKNQSTSTPRPDRFNCPPPQNTSPASTSGNNPIAINNTAAAAPHMSIASDLPIARRVSLNRFLEKRKGRISSKAPYQVDGSPDPSSSGESSTPEKKGGEPSSGFGKPEGIATPSAMPEPSLGKTTLGSQNPEEKKWLGLATPAPYSPDLSELEIQRP